MKALPIIAVALVLAFLWLHVGCEAPASKRSWGDHPAPAASEAASSARKTAARSGSDSSLSSAIQPGTLTAAGIDDVADFRFFHRALDEVNNHSSADVFGKLARALREPKVVVRVTDSAGRPAGDTPIRVIGRDERTLATLRTGLDGIAVFATGHDAHGSDAPYFFQVGRGDHATTEVVNQLNQTDVTQVADQPAAADTTPVVDLVLKSSASSTADDRPRLDVALVIDCTGSMADELEYLKVELRDVVQRIAQMHEGVEQRWALVVYRDRTDEYETRHFSFTDDPEKLIDWLGRQSASGGGDEPEAVHAAFADAAKFDWSADKAARLMFWLADAPPHADRLEDTMKKVDAFRSRGVRMFPVASSSASATCELTMRSVAALTAGRYQFLTDHSGVGNPHREPKHAAKYTVEPMRDLIVRVVHEELQGNARPIHTEPDADVELADAQAELDEVERVVAEPTRD